MKVAILTLRIHSNFGYLMQMYALQTIVRDLGHDPFTFFIKIEPPTFYARFKETIYNIYLKVIKHQNVNIVSKHPTNEELEVYDKNSWDFIKYNIKLTDYFKTPRDFFKFDTNEYDFYIVGSDQVWREPYTISLPLYYFNFLPDNKRRMSYAASFGRGDISEYSRSQKKVCRTLLKKFNCITVREEDGIDICLKEFGEVAYQVLDPTLLLSPEKYMELASRGRAFDSSSGYVIAYILDQTVEKTNLINDFANKMNLKVIYILKGEDNNELESYPHVYDILNSFLSAKYIFTDSFHACVFSILFKKQFYVFPNLKRGNSRIESLLKKFRISNRMISDNLCDDNIDYNSVFNILEILREDSLRHLNTFLNEF